MLDAAGFECVGATGCLGSYIRVLEHNVSIHVVILGVYGYCVLDRYHTYTQRMVYYPGHTCTDIY